MPSKPPRQHVLASLIAVAIAAAGCPFAVASDEFTPRPQRVFTEKPRIEDYSDYNAFLVDIMEYRRQKQERAAAVRQAQPVDDAALAGIAGQQDVDPALYRIDGPESLDDALARARKLPHPTYEEPERFGRTTSFSFPIPSLEGEDMAVQDIEGRLADLESVNPEAYEDETAEQQAIGVLARDPDNVDETQDQQASEGTDDAYRASYDPNTRYVTDSDGKRYWAPIFVEGEYGYTIIRVLDIEVATYK